MRSLFLATLFTAIGLASTDSRPTVEVYLPPSQVPMDRAFFQAQGVVTRIYAGIGIKVIWKMKTASAGCSKFPRRVVMNFSSQTAGNFHPGALAYANPFANGGDCVTIFTDRLHPMLAGNPATTVHLLGHVLAHEIAHVLQGIDRHSKEGVLKPGWSPREIRELATKPLRFSSHDASLIHDSLRAARLTGPDHVD